MPVGIQVQRSRLPVDVDIVDAARPQPLRERLGTAEQASGLLAPVEGITDGGSLAATLGVRTRVHT